MSARDIQLECNQSGEIEGQAHLDEARHCAYGMKPRPTDANVQREFTKPGASKTDLFFYSLGGVYTPLEAAKLKSEIAKVGVPPEQALMDAAKNNQVLGFGDVHGPFGPQIGFLTDELPKLKASGVTHLAVEVQHDLQPFLNDWSKSDQTFFQNQLKDSVAFTKLITKAKGLGIKVIAVDKHSLYGATDPTRDVEMSNRIASILQDKHNKVLFFVGANHLQDGKRRDTNAPSTAQLLRDKHISVSTFYPQWPSQVESLMPVARDLKEPLSVKTIDAIDVYTSLNFDHDLYGKWDNVIFYPPGFGMDRQAEELKAKGQDPASSLEDAFRSNRVVLLGEMDGNDPYHPDSVHREYMAKHLPDLKRAGLTDLAIDIPQSNQKTLDRFSKTGVINLQELPPSFAKQDFKSVLVAARSSGIKLHAVGQNSPFVYLRMVDLEVEVSQLAKPDPRSKILVWSGPEMVANYADANIKQAFSFNQIPATSYSTLSQNITQSDVGLVTGALKKPIAVNPVDTEYVSNLRNTQSMPASMFDKVIIYPSNQAK